MSEKRNAVVLLSGGIDSATTAAIAIADGFDVHALTFSYGQRHAVEITAAKRVADSLGILRHSVCEIDLRLFGGSALTADVAIPKNRSPAEMSDGVPPTYVPARNTIFLSLALGVAESVGSTDIYIGANAVDYSGYPDCRPEFMAAFEHVANLGTKAGVSGSQFKIHAPLVSLSKPDVIRKGLELGVDYSLTHSCYDPDSSGAACGQCDSCVLRRNAFREVGVADSVACRA